METVGDVMESIKDLKGLISFLNVQEELAAKGGNEHDADSFADVALALGDYVNLLKRQKLKEEF